MQTHIDTNRQTQTDRQTADPLVLRNNRDTQVTESEI